MPDLAFGLAGLWRGARRRVLGAFATDVRRAARCDQAERRTRERRLPSGDRVGPPPSRPPVTDEAPTRLGACGAIFLRAIAEWDFTVPSRGERTACGRAAPGPASAA